MASLRQDPYLWWHLAGAATLPLWLGGCLAGLAVGDPVINVWVEQGLLIALGITLPLGLQWLRPIYLFRVGPLALSPAGLTDTQVRSLSLQRRWPQKAAALLTAIVLSSILIRLYRVAPIAAAATPFASLGRTSGWLLCAGCFALPNWLGQTAISALGLLLARERTLEQTQPDTSTAIAQHFSGLFIQVGQVFPRQWLQENAPLAATEDMPTPTESVATEIPQDSADEVPIEAKTELEAEQLKTTDPIQPEAEQTMLPAEAEITPMEPAETEPQPAEPAQESIDTADVSPFSDSAPDAHTALDPAGEGDDVDPGNAKTTGES